MSATVRRARAEDADALGAVVSASWRAAYAGLVPDALLAQQDPAVRAVRYRSLLADGGERRFWIAEDGTDAVGFAATCRSRDADAGPAVAELAALYVLDRAWGRSIGRALQRIALADLATRGFDEATLWVLASNDRARRFYERTDWTLELDGVAKELQGFELVEARYRRRLVGFGPPPGHGGR